ncbi:phosphofurin acidic cluster sorting protein 2-like [Tigriopus californicus]|uniref:phosphofurin acidic cluster sorting protein 2-like n=1 Tax=Tigriopus californicus TaxID=6832 RepID=UPI0027DA1576|nr:phosphofurin acidic cluster sorting protein 2-like [Tigriopus californicus]
MTSVVGGPFRPPAGSTGSHAGGAVGGGGSGPASLHLGVTSPGGTQSGFSASSSHHFLGGAQGAAGVKPVPMKLFATWEVDRTPPNCIPRLCTLTLTRLVLNKSLGADLNSVIIAVKMQSSKRTLRSNEIELPPSGLLDTELELTFSLQYPHFLKREGNQLHIMLQRRKRYKNRTILGFKTLATGIINMSQVLQKQMDLELELYGDVKEKTAGSAIGKVFMLSLSSQPVDHNEEDSASQAKGVQGEGADRDLYSDEDEDFSSAEEGSDSEPMLDDIPPSSRRFRKPGRVGTKGIMSANSAAAVRQRNLKQKFVALLKKFKVTDPDELEHERVSLDQKLSEGTVDPAEIEDLFEQLEDFSDSGPDVDTISIGSTPKPSLKPFFCSSKNLLNEARVAVNEISLHKDSTNLVTSGQNVAGSGAGNPFGSLTMASITPTDQTNTASNSGVGGSHGGAGVVWEVQEVDQAGQEAVRAVIGSAMTVQRRRCPTRIQKRSRIPSFLIQKTSSSGENRRSRLFAKEKRGEGSFSLKQQKIVSSSASSAAQMANDMNHSSNPTASLSSTTMASISNAMPPHPIRIERMNSQQDTASVSNHGSEGAITIDRIFRSGFQILASGDNYSMNRLPTSLHMPIPRKVLLEQLSRVLPSDANALPDQIFLANTCDRQGAHLATKLAECGRRVICTAGPADVKATLTCLVAKIQKFCNTKTESPPSVKVVLIGSDTFVNSVLRPYVDVFSSKPPDWQSYIKFFIIPLGVNTVSKYIGSHDPTYSSLFLHESWRELLEKAEPGKSDVIELVSRINQYLDCPTECLLHLPVAEAMVTYKEKSSDEESTSQVFIPFVSDVRVGSDGHGNHSIDLDEASSTMSIGGAGGSGSNLVGSNSDRLMNEVGSPSASGSNLTGSGNARDKLSPPSSPHVGKDGRTEFFSEPVDLQLDYWIHDCASNSNSMGSNLGPGSRRGEGNAKNDAKKSSKDDLKSSIKTSIRFMQIQKSSSGGIHFGPVFGNEPQSSSSPSNSGIACTFSMQYWIKEKKPKTVMRLGKKKEKDGTNDVKSQSVDGITRLICLSKAQNPLKVHIDGLEWLGVKFFQLSSQWQTHIKSFPIATFHTGSNTQTAL